jgi:hypothetical protein
VRDLGGRPHGDLLAGRVDHGRPGLHEGRDQPLLAVLPLDHDAVLPGLRDRLVDVAAAARLGGVEGPDRGDVGAQVRVREHRVLGGLPQVEGGRQLVVLHLDELGGVPRGGSAPRDHDRDDLAGEAHPVDRHRGVVGSLLLGAERPGVGDDALHLGDLAAEEDVGHVRRALRRCRVDTDDPRVGERAAHHRDVQHPRQGDVVGPAGAPGDQSLVLLAATVAADLGDGSVGARLLGGGHADTPSPDVEPAACCTARTMLW